MKQIVLSIEQMKHLESLGLNTSDASMRYTYNDENDYWALTLNPNLPYIEGEQVPAYTLQDCINHIPNSLEWIADRDNFELYDESLEKYPLVYSVHGFDLQSLYQALVWCIKNNYIKTNK